MKVVSNSTVVPNTADRSFGVQKVFSVTDEGGCFLFYQGTYSLPGTNRPVKAGMLLAHY